MRLVDFQISKVATPAFDVSHFLAVSAPKSVLDNLSKYLELYYKTISDFLKELGSDPDVVYPHHVFREHWKKHARFGLTISLFAFRFFLSEEDEAPKMTTKEEFAQTFIIDKMVNQEEHDQRLSHIVTAFVKMGVAE